MRQLWPVAFILCCAMAAPAWSFVDANTASAADLSTIKGLGPSTSQRLVQARQQGAFQNWDDMIDRVTGVGPATAQKLSDSGLRIQGQAFRPLASSTGAAGGGGHTAEAIWRPMIPKPLPPR
jgi:competence protein ComEA